MEMLIINHAIQIPLAEIDVNAIRAQGAGGQNVNKVSSAIHLRFDIQSSSLPAEVKQRLIDQGDQRITKQGVVVIKAQQYRTQEANRQDALQRLQELLKAASHVQKHRKATRPSRSSQRRRLDAKSHRGKTKALRGKVI